MKLGLTLQSGKADGERVYRAGGLTCCNGLSIRPP